MWSEKAVPSTPSITATSPSPSPECAGPLKPGAEILGNNKDLLFPGAFSSFAISVDSGAIGYSSSASSSRRSSAASSSSSHGSHGVRRPSAMKHGRSSSSGDYTPRSAHHPPSAYGRQVLSTIPASPLMGHPDTAMQSNPYPNKVRWGQDSEYMYTPYLHQQKCNDSPRIHSGRRRSTAAIIEYISNYIHAHTGYGAAALMTPKRISVLFLVVFSAVYLALNLLPSATFLNDEIRHGSTRDGHRHQGYYGNSRIFRSGEGLRDPHSAGDEHDEYGHGAYRRYQTYEDDVPEDYKDRFELAAREQRQRGGSRLPRVAVPSANEDDDDEYATAKLKKLRSGSLDGEARLADFRASLNRPAGDVVINNPGRKGKSPMMLNKSRNRKLQETTPSTDFDIPEERTAQAQVSDVDADADDGLDADVDAAASGSSRFLMQNKQPQRRVMVNPARRRNTVTTGRYIDNNLDPAKSASPDTEAAIDVAGRREQEIWNQMLAHPRNKRIIQEREHSDFLTPRSQVDSERPLGRNAQAEVEKDVAEQEHLSNDIAHASLFAEM